MDEPVVEALRRTVAASRSPEELERRVVESFGEGQVALARRIAAETKGPQWAALSRTLAPLRPPENQHSLPYRIGLALAAAACSPPRLVLLVGSLVLLLVVLFPPYFVALPDGLQTNAGFAFILSPPQVGKLVALVNAPFLGIEVAAVVCITIGLHLALLKK